MEADDARHPVLRRARPVGEQSRLDSFGGGAPTRARRSGAWALQEVDARSALTVSGLPGQPYSLNCYVGCTHDCAYCYVPDILRVERERWGSYVAVKRNVASLLAREVRRREPRPVYMSSATDPYVPPEQELRVTRRCLEVLRDARWPLRLLTRSPLVTRDIDVLGGFGDLLVGLSVPTIDDDLRRAVEPGAPPIPARLAALRALADAGLRPFVNYVPAYPLVSGSTAEDVARSFADAGVAVVHAGAWQYLDSVLPEVRRRLPPAVADAFAREAQDPAAVARGFGALRTACEEAGVRFEVIGPAPQRRARREIRWVEGASGRRG